MTGAPPTHIGRNEPGGDSSPKRQQKFARANGNADTYLAIALGASFAVLYACLAWRLSRGHFFEHFNLLFDYDSPAYVDLFAPRPGAISRIDSAARAIKHPLSPWLSLVSLPFRALGVDRVYAACLANACVGGGTVALFFGFARSVGTPRVEASLLTLIFAIGAAQLFSSMIVESYSYAALSLALVWWIAAQRMFKQARFQVAALAAAVAAFGITVTNVLQAAVAELFVQWSRNSAGRALCNTAVVGLAVGALSALAVAVTWPEAVSFAFSHPGAAAREIYWQQTKGPKTGLLQVLLTFFAFSLAAPTFDTIPLPEGVLMRDFRTFDSSLLWLGGVTVWNALFLSAAVAAWRTERTRKMASALLGAIAFNVLMHLSVQYRGSLFIYTPDLWFAIVAVTALGLGAFAEGGAVKLWLLRALLVGVLLAIVPLNLWRAHQATVLFDDPSTFTIPASSP